MPAVIFVYGAHIQSCHLVSECDSSECSVCALCMYCVCVRDTCLPLAVGMCDAYMDMIFNSFLLLFFLFSFGLCVCVHTVYPTLHRYRYEYMESVY